MMARVCVHDNVVIEQHCCSVSVCIYRQFDGTMQLLWLHPDRRVVDHYHPHVSVVALSLHQSTVDIHFNKL